MRLLVLSVRYFGEVKWDLNVVKGPSARSWWGRVRGAVCRGWEDNPPRWGWFQVPPKH